MAIFRTQLLQPSAIVAHEIPEPARVRVPGVLDEGGKARGVYFG
jgi:hypothetical protein